MTDVLVRYKSNNKYVKQTEEVHTTDKIKLSEQYF